MNGRKVKALRKLVYKNGTSPKDRKHQTINGGQVVADLHRSVYQELKKEVRHLSIADMKRKLKGRKPDEEVES